MKRREKGKQTLRPTGFAIAVLSALMNLALVIAVGVLRERAVDVDEVVCVL